jgi:hypothetical protein
MAKTWFIFTGTNPCNPNDYMLVGPPPSCPGSNVICAIFAEPDGSGTRPVISPTVCCEMVNALNSGTDTANVLLRT